MSARGGRRLGPLPAVIEPEVYRPRAAWLAAKHPAEAQRMLIEVACLSPQFDGWSGPLRERVIALLGEERPDPQLADILLAKLNQDPACREAPGAVVAALRASGTKPGPLQLVEAFDEANRRRTRYHEWTLRWQDLSKQADAAMSALRRPFSDCASVRECELWAQANYPLVSWSLAGADVALLNTTLRQFERLASLYPSAVADQLREVIVAPIEVDSIESDPSDRWLRNAIASYGEGTITFNLKRYRNAQNLEKRTEKMGKTGWSRVQDAAGIMTHEFGHLLHAWLLEVDWRVGVIEEDRLLLLSTNWNYQRRLTPYVDGPFGTVGGTLQLWLEQHDAVVSKYCRVNGNYAERFAEAFVSIQHDSPEQRPEHVRRLALVLDHICNADNWHVGKIQEITELPPAAAAQARSEHLAPLALELGLSLERVERLLINSQEAHDRIFVQYTLSDEGPEQAMAQRQDYARKRLKWLKARAERQPLVPQLLAEAQVRAAAEANDPKQAYEKPQLESLAAAALSPAVANAGETSQRAPEL